MIEKFLALIFLSFLLILSSQPVLGVDFVNPIGTGTSASTTFDEMLVRILSWLWPLSLAIAVLMILIGAYYMVLSGGDPQKVATGKKVVMYALIGVAIVTISRGIVELVRLILGI